MKEGEDKLVWMQRRKGVEWRASRKLKKRNKRRESSVAQRGKGTAKWCTVRRTRRNSKRKKEQHAHREEKHSKRGG